MMYTEKFIPNNSEIHFRWIISTYGIYAVSSWKFRNVWSKYNHFISVAFVNLCA